MDGSITLKTKIDNSGVKKQLDELNKKIELQEEKFNNTKDSLSQVNNELKNSNTELNGMMSKYDVLSSKIKKMQAQASTKGLSTGGYNELDKTISEREKLGNSIDKTYAKIQKEEKQQQKLTMSLKQQKLQYDQLIGKKQKLESKSFAKDSVNITKMNNGLKQGIKTLSRYALALFSLSTIYSALSSSANSWLISNDIGAKQLSANIEYMKWAIGKSLQPVIETLVSWMYKLLQLIGMVANALFKVNIFSSASSKNFEKANKSTSGIAKNTKETKNNMAKFDNLDVLNDDKDKSSGGGEDFTMPSMDLSNMDMKVPNWMQWILDNGDLIKKILIGIAAGLVALKLGFDPIQSLGIGMMVSGIVSGLNDIKKLIENPSWENFGKVLEDIGLTIAGFGVFKRDPLTALLGACIYAIGQVITHWDELKKLGIEKEVSSALGGITSALLLLKLGLSGIMSLGIGVAIASIIYTIQSVLDYLDNPSWENFGKIITGIGVAILGVAIAIGAWPVAIAGAIVAIIGLIVTNWETIKKFLLGIGQWFEKNFGMFGEEINRHIKDIVNGAQILFKGFKQIFDGILKIARGDLAGGLKTIFKGVVNVIISTLNNLISAFNTILTPVRTMIVAFGKVTGKTWKMSNIKIPSIKRLAKGGIVNNPRRGVDVNVGEDGSEMILPIEKNTGWMDMLADKIASRTGGDRPLNIKATGSLSQLIRLLKLELDKEDDRRGSSMITGGVI